MIITGLPTLDSSIRAIRLGASNYILKPFRLDDVAAAIKKAMKEREIISEIKKLRENVADLEKNVLRSSDIDVKSKVPAKLTPSPESRNIPNLPPPLISLEKCFILNRY